jgi:putative Mg2+ transporter-C (MgtC) family protein
LAFAAPGTFGVQYAAAAGKGGTQRDALLLSFSGQPYGLDRELRHKPTGLRTVTGCHRCHLFTLLGLQMASVTAGAGYDATGDIGRILQGLISGIGILGAGVFLHRGGTVRLATTGATVWLAGAAGVAAGLGLYILAVAATALAILVLVGFGNIERRFLELHESSAPPRDDR